VAFAVAFEGVALRNLVVRRLGGEGIVPEGLEAGIQMGSLLDLDLDPDDNLLAGHQEVDHIPQDSDLDQAGYFLEGEHMGGLLVGLGLIVNWEGAVDVVASSVGVEWEQDLDLGLAGHGH